MAQQQQQTMVDSDTEREKKAQSFQPDWVKDQPRFAGTEPEQAQVQRTTQQQKKHDDFYKQELRQEGISLLLFLLLPSVFRQSFLSILLTLPRTPNQPLEISISPSTEEASPRKAD